MAGRIYRFICFIERSNVMSFECSSRMNHFQTSIFSELAAYKMKKIEEGHDMIDLSIGSPDLPPPSFVMEELAKSANNPSLYRYSLAGTTELHEAITAYYLNKYNVSLQREREVVMSMGSQDALVHLPMALVNRGDVILVPDPGYTAYAAGIALAEATPYPMPLKEENGFLPDLEQIPEAILQKAKVMILNFPGNPIPVMATKEFFEHVVAIAKKYKLIVIHDFAYSELYYRDQPISFLSIAGAKEVGIECNSLSKSFNMAGCRIGYVVGNEAVIKTLDKLKSNLDYGVFLPIQQAAIRALTNSTNFSKEQRSVYKRRRDILMDGFHSLGWNVESPQASMFVWAKLPAHYSSKEFTYKLMDQAGVVVTPGMAFGENGEGYVRIALVQSEEQLKRAIERIKKSGMLG